MHLGRINDTVESQAQVVEGYPDDALAHDDTVNIVQEKNFNKTEKRYNNNDKFRKYPQTVGRIWKNEKTVHKSPNSHSRSDRKC